MDKIDSKVNQLDGFIRSRKVQILPTNYQINIIQQWFYDTTCIYNKLVTHLTRIYEKYSKISSTNQILGNFIKNNKELPLNFQNLRKLKIDEFTKDYYMTPYCIIADTIKEFVSNAKSCVTKLVKNQINNFNFVHRKTNRVYRSITIESHYTTERGFYPSLMGKIETNDSNFSWCDVNHDYKLIYDKYENKYYVNVPKYVFRNKSFIRNPIGILDPGMRTFQTLYGLDHVIKIGNDMIESISKRLLKIDDLQSKINSSTKNRNVRKHKYKRSINRHHKKIEHLQQELHYKTSIYLCEHYDRIMVTDFSSKNVSRKEGNLNKMNKRILGKLSHYKFRLFYKKLLCNFL